MIRLVLMCAALLSWSFSFGNDAPKTDAVSVNEGKSDAGAEWVLGERDMQVLRKAQAVGATQVDRAVASDVCSHKCKICYDGKMCDYECVKKYCSEK
jgi:hypothetical protein